MTQVNSAAAIHDDLTAFRDQVRSTRVLAGFLTFLTVLAGGVLVFSFLAGTNTLAFLRAPLVRWTALIALIACAATTFLALVLRPLLWNPTFDALARSIEERIPDLDNAYINAVQLARERRSDSPLLLIRAMDECRSRTRQFDIASAVDKSGFKRRAIAGGIVAALLLIYMLAAPASFSAGLSMLVNPSRFVPSVGAVRIAYIKPGSVEVIRGQDVTLDVGLRAALKTIPSGRVRMIAIGGDRTEKDLLAVSSTEFRVSLGPAQLPYDYLVEIGGTQTNWYHVGVTERPSVKSIALTYEYPRYTGKGHDIVANASGDISAPVGTTVSVEVEGTRPLASGRLQFDDGQIELLPAGGEYKRAAAFTLRKDGFYRISLTDTSGNLNDASVPHAVKAVLDQPPVVTMPVPGRDTSASLGDKLVMAVEASDDYGIGSAELVISDAENPRQERVLARWDRIMVKAATLTYVLEVDPRTFAAGKAYSFYARAKDNNTLSGPGEGHSQKYVLRIIDSAAAQAEAVKNLESWIDRLKKVLADQEAAREDAKSADATSDRAAAVVAGVRDRQDAIRTDTAGIAHEMAGGVAAIESVRRVLDALVAGDMTAAIDACDTVVKKTPIAPADVAALAAAQDRIIETLKHILGALGVLLEDAKTGKLAEGNAIPSDAEDALRKLLDDLKEFAEAQKRIIEATNNLAARPVNDYTEEDKSKLKELKTAEENWSKFLKEAYSDISKLPTQDFSNPSMLKDVVETYSEVEMAADALSREPATIAVPHEQAGLELAEELTTHLEKWLSDAPDRLKWEMEEPLKDVDVPMAQLPSSLQDIVGDLMEQEEDLFSDVEDVSSSWADSLDKGAGWDAMDGPISNMSAQGVTGNTLPNSSEIGGRSGEGRTGRSAGEFVGDSAVGKGGRRTPTRITPDPFVAGDIKDTSPEASGGATGGGKESGAGELGLQGQVPKELAKAIERLHGKQAQIISKAQKLNIALKLANYPNGDMSVALESMNATDSAILSGRLGNAIRQRPSIIAGLKGVSGVVGNDLVVNKDTSLVLPKGLQDDIMDGAQGRAPRGYDKLLKGYYESLSSSK
jgi:hypothetical protein